MSGSKTLRNETGYPVQVILDVRKGSDPKDHLTNVDVSLDTGETKTVQYGDDGHENNEQSTEREDAHRSIGE